MTANAMKSFITDLHIAEPVVCQNLAVVPLTGGDEAPPDYQTLDEAIAAGTLAVAEVSEGGHVPELAVQNAGLQPVLMLDGEELVGAKQNRILNLTVLVPAQSKLVIPVSCVEQGRWRSMSAHFTSGHYAPAPLRSNKERSVRQNLRACNIPASDQGQVWSDVGDTLARLSASSPTMAMSDAYEKMEADLREAAARITLPADTCGLAAFVTDELLVVDLFGYQSTFRQTSGKLLDSYLLVALSELGLRTNRKKPLDAALYRKRTAETLERAAAGEVEQRRTVGLGTDLRITADAVRGAALLSEGVILHASLFPDDTNESATPANLASQHSTRMASPRRRRTNG